MIRFTRRTAVWLIGAAALVAATGAAGLVGSSASPTLEPKPAADQGSATKNAIAAIVAHHPGIGKPVADLVQQGSLPKPTYAGDTGRIGVPKNAPQPGAPADAGAVRYVPGSVKGDFNLLQLGALALWVGCSPSEAPIAAAIAAAESGGNPGAQGDITLMDSTWDWSQGLWQIRGLRSERGTGGLRDSLANADPQKNAHAMYTISSGCTDWTPWSTYTSGAYLAYLGMSKTAVLAAKQFQTETGALPTFGTGGPVTVPAAQSTSASARPSKHPSKHHTSSPSAHKSAHPRKHNSGAPNVAPSSTAAGAPTSKAPAPVRTSAPQAPPNPVSSVIKKVTSAVPTKLPLPTKTKKKLPLPKPVSSIVGGLTSAVPSIVP